MSGNAATITVSAGETTGDSGPSTSSATSDGFITGVEPAKSPDQIRAEQQAANRPPETPRPQSEGGRLFTEQEVETFRSQERDKLHSRLEETATEVKRLREEREAERAAQEEAVKAAEAEAQRKAEEGMDAKDMIVKVREDLEAQLEEARQDAARAQALAAKEREFAELNLYRQQRLQAVQDRIVPEIADFISGDTPEQIDASIADALERSDRIVQGMMAAQQQQLQGMQGTRTTLPSGVGPLEEQQAQRQLTDQDIRNMPMSEYQAMRGTLHQAGRAQFYGNR